MDNQNIYSPIKNKLFVDAGLVSTLDKFITYTKTLGKEDYLKLITRISKFMINSEFKDGSFYIAIHNIRQEFGRTLIDGKQTWKLSLLLTECIKCNVLERSNYSFGNEDAHSRIYRFTDTFINEYDKEQVALSIEEISSKTYKIISSSVVKPFGNLAVHYDLLQSDRFNIDVEAALEWIEKNSSGQLKILRIASLIQLFEKRIFVKEDKITGRIFTNFTSLKRELRSYCTIDNEPLHSIDLKSSQPLLFLNFLISMGIDNKELEDYKNIIVNEDVYLYFLKEFIRMNGSNKYSEYDVETKTFVEKEIVTRQDAKVEFFRFLYKTSNTGVPCPFQKVFMELFPILYYEISKIRKTTNIAVMLQKIEASIFIPVVHKYVKQGCLSLHDGIYFKKELQDDIVKDLVNSFEKNKIVGYKLISE